MSAGRSRCTSDAEPGQLAGLKIRTIQSPIYVKAVELMGASPTPMPVGVGLSIAAGIARVDIDEASRSYVPYLIALLVGLAPIAAFPFSRSHCRGCCWGTRGETRTRSSA